MITDYIKKYLENVSQSDIAKRTDLSQSKVSLILNNKRKLSADELVRIAIEFNINLESIKKEIIQSTNLKWFL